MALHMLAITSDADYCGMQHWMHRLAFGFMLIASLFGVASVQAEDGYDLWTRYRPLAPKRAAVYRPSTTQLNGRVAYGADGPVGFELHGAESGSCCSAVARIRGDEKLAARFPYAPKQLPIARREDGSMWDW